LSESQHDCLGYVVQMFTKAIVHP